MNITNKNNVINKKKSINNYFGGKRKKKKKIMMLAILIVSLFAVSAVSAADNATADVVNVNDIAYDDSDV